MACRRLTGDRRYYIIFLPALSQLYCETYKASGAGILQLSPSLDTLSRWSAWKQTSASSHLPQEERGLCLHHQDAPASWHSSKPASFTVTFLQMLRPSPHQACFLFGVSLFSNPNQPLSSLPVRNSCSTGGGSPFFLETKHELETKQDKQKQRLQYPVLPSTSPCNRNHACYHNLVKS